MSLEQDFKRYELLGQITNWLTKNPDDHRLFALAVADGMAAGLQAMNLARARADQAMLAALSLGDGKRTSPAVKEMLYQRIAQAINEGNASPVEKHFLKLADESKPCS